MARINTDFEGLILFRRDYREHDLLVKFLTRKLGPTMFFVRGGRRKGSKIASALLPFSYGTYVGWLEAGELSYLVAAKETHQFKRIGPNLEANAYATYLLDLVGVAFEEGRAIGAWYDQVLTALKLIEAGMDSQVIVNVLEVQLLGRFGVAPIWDGCVICGRQDLPLDYSEALGGVLCQQHWSKDPHRLHLDRKTVNYLRMFAHLNLQKVANVKVDQATRRGLRQALDQVYTDQVGLRLKSKHFIDSLMTWQDQLSLPPRDSK
ncbi:DNA repair protein RecO [Lactobacillus alvi]|uniref:DNA repair protein RecO n=1 Tax=Limosilactobacillus alvi TaxID=990412 RepID=A0ABS2EP46_9LACO|nr:DNA repair protein RecO [Limosilactobacillus alvi]